MDEIFEKLKYGAGKLKKNAAKVTKNVMQKTNDAVSQTKLSFAINETESKLSELYEDMGRSVYSDYLKSGEVSRDMAERCFQADKLLAEISDLKEKIAELKHSVKCPDCGEYNKDGSSYCSACGKELKDAGEAESARDEETASEAAEETAEEVTAETPKKVVTIRARRPVNPED